MITRRLFRWFDDRLGASHFTRESLRKIFPDHWSFMLGEIAMYTFIILVLTGIFLALYYVPDHETVIYQGPYEPLRGEAISRAYQSVLEISFQVKAGLVFRQIHHWAALVMVAAVVTHMARVFFTGAFRKPRDLNWMLGVTLLILTLAIGFAGYSLPDDLLSGTGLRIAYSIVLAVPFVGPWLASFIFGGEYPGPEILNRLFTMHIFVLPALIAAVLTVHLMIVWRQKHTHFPGNGRTEDNIQGERLWPRYTLKSLGLFLVIAATLSLLGGLAQINPVWLFGLYNAHAVSAGSQPDWYVGWLEGALRLFPNYEIQIGGFLIPNPFFPAVLMPGVVFGVMYAWPWIERKITKDHAEHNLLNFPRDMPWRTAFGAAAIVFFTILTLAGGNDLIAAFFGTSVEAITRVLRGLIVALPLLAYAVTYWICRELKSKQEHPIRLATIDVVTRTATGGFRSTAEYAGGGYESAELEEAEASPRKGE